MSKIIQIVKKNFKEMIRNKLSLSVLFLGPLLIIFLLGFFYYNDNSYSLNLGVFADENSSLLPIYVQGFKESGLNVVDFNNYFDCEEAIKVGLIHACIIFPEYFELAPNKTNLVKIKVDDSQGKVIDLLEHSIYTSFEIQTEKIQLEHTDILINNLEDVEKSINNWKENISNITQLIDELKESNDDIRNYLVKLDLMFNPENLKVEKINERAESVNASIYNMVNSSAELVFDLENKVNNISKLINDGNFSDSEVSDIKDLLSDSEDLVDSLERKIISFGDTYQVRKLQEELGNLQLKLVDLEDGFDEGIYDIKNEVKINEEKLDLIEDNLDFINSDSNQLLTNFENIEVRDSSSLVKPVNLEVSSISENSKNHLSTIFPSLIASLILIIGMFLSSNLVLQEKKSTASFRNYMAKSSSFVFLFGNFLALFIIVFIQISIIILVYYLMFFKVSFLEIFFVFLFIMPIIALFVLIGMFIGNLSKSETINSVILFVLIFCFLTFSGVLLPIEILSSFVQSLALLNPYIVSEGILRKLIIFNSSFSTIFYETIILLVYIILFLVLNIIMESFIRKKKLYHYYVFLVLKFKEKFKKKFNNFGKKKSKRKDIFD